MGYKKLQLDSPLQFTSNVCFKKTGSKCIITTFRPSFFETDVTWWTD